jgi:DNA polymerase-4
MKQPVERRLAAILAADVAGSRTGQKTRSELEQLGNALLEPLFPVTKGVRLLGLSLSSLAVEEAERQRQVSLSL